MQEKRSSWPASQTSLSNTAALELHANFGILSFCGFAVESFSFSGLRTTYPSKISASAEKYSTVVCLGFISPLKGFEKFAN